MLDQQLTAAVEQVGERTLAVARVEFVILVDTHPWQRPTLGGDLVAQTRQFLFTLQQTPALSKPFIVGDDAMAFDAFCGFPGIVGCCRVHRSNSFIRL